MTEAGRGEREWLRRIVARMERAYKKIPEPYWLKGDWPLWVTNVGRELSKALFPTANLKVSPDWEPGEVGAILGQKIAYAAYDLRAEVKKVSLKKPEWQNLRAIFGKDIKKRVETFEKKFQNDFVPDFVRALKFAMGLAIEQDYDDCAKFFAAFGRAIQRKPLSAGDIGRTNTKIYIFLLVFWRSVQKLESVRALHKVLCNVFGNHIVGEEKRIEKMCQRLDLHFGPRGRRKHREIQTISS